MKFQEFVTEDRRLVILRLLVECGGELNESVIHEGCRSAGHSHGVTRDLIREDIGWLKERDLIHTEFFAETVTVAKITRRGVDVANGDLHVDGVKRPSMGV